MPHLADLTKKMQEKDIKGAFAQLTKPSKNKQDPTLNDVDFARAITEFDAAMAEAGTAKSRHIRLLNELFYIVTDNAALASLEVMLHLPLIEAQLDAPNHELHKALYCYQPAVIERLLKTNKFDVNYENEHYHSPLYSLGTRYEAAAQDRVLKTFDLLVEAGANINFATFEGETVLVRASRPYNPICLKLLENANIQLECLNGEMRALATILVIGKMTEAIYTKFLEAYVDYEIKRKSILFPLLIADQLSFSSTVSENNELHKQCWPKLLTFLQDPQRTPEFKEKLAKALAPHIPFIAQQIEKIGARNADSLNWNCDEQKCFDAILEVLGLEVEAKEFPTAMMSAMLTQLGADRALFTPTNAVHTLLKYPDVDPVGKVKLIMKALIAPLISASDFYLLLNAYNRNDYDKVLELVKQGNILGQTMSDLKQALHDYLRTKMLFLYAPSNHDSIGYSSELGQLLGNTGSSQRQGLKKLLINLLKTQQTDLLGMLQTCYQRNHQTYFEYIIKVHESGYQNSETGTYRKKYKPLMEAKSKQPKVSKSGHFAEKNVIEMKETPLSQARPGTKNL